MSLPRDPRVDIEIIELLADGLSTKMIADRMKYEISTIDTYRVMILRKFKAKNTAQLISDCYQKGILKIKPQNGDETNNEQNHQDGQEGLLREYLICH